MNGFVCLGDPTSHGGRVVTATSKISINGKPVAQVGDLVSCPQQGHGINPIIYSNSACITDKTRICLNGAKAACGCIIYAQEQTKGEENS